MLYLQDCSLASVLRLSVCTKNLASCMSVRCMQDWRWAAADSRRWLMKIKVGREKEVSTWQMTDEWTTVISHWGVGREFYKRLHQVYLITNVIWQICFLFPILCLRNLIDISISEIMCCRCQSCLLQCCLKGSALAWMKMFECREGESEH